MRQTHKRFAFQCSFILAWVLGMLFAVNGPAFSGDDRPINLVSKPNLIPFQVPGWTDKIPVSKTWGVTTDDSPLYTTDTLYTAWAVLNDSDSTVPGFDIYFYVDDLLDDITSVTDLGPNEYYYIRYHSIGSLTAGAHTLKVVADPSDVIDESSESDNEYTRTITVIASSPGKVTLLSPSGNIQANTPTYTWNADPNSTWYYLWVDDSKGTKIKQWYEAADAGCAGGTGTCSITPQTPLAGGPANWWIQTYNTNGYGAWSDGMAFSVGLPGKVTLVAPSGNIKSNTPAYSWNADPFATWYYLWVDDSKGTKILQWYKAADAGCPDGKGTCSASPQTALAGGAAKWWVQTYNANGYGPWSDGMAFSVGTPGKVTLVAPSGKITTNKPSYSWNADPDATWYYLWVEDSTGPKIKQWCKAADAGCAGGTGTCSVTPQTALGGGSAKWYIQTYNDNGYGPWSDALGFSMGLPGKVTLSSPSGNITTHTPSFSWIADPETTWYYLWVEDGIGTKVKTWYKAADAGCPEGWGTCTVSPGKTLTAGAGKWWVQTYNASGYGPWSDPMSFNVGTIYDGVWTQTGSLKIERIRFAATLLNNGEVLVVGGSGYSALPLVCSDVYDPDTWKWYETGNLNFERQDHTATLLNNGKVLAAGGYGIGQDFRSSELYDPETGKWTLTGNLNVKRSDHTATLLLNGKVLVVGGWGPGGAALGSSELYDPATGKWTSTGSLNFARSWHTATLLPSGKVLVAGGLAGSAYLQSSELYDPDTGQWTQTGNLKSARSSHTATLLKTDEVLVAGGGGSTGTLKSSELYNPGSGTWSETGSLNFGRLQHKATLLKDGRVLAIAGNSGNDILTSAEVYER